MVQQYMPVWLGKLSKSGILLSLICWPDKEIADSTTQRAPEGSYNGDRDTSALAEHALTTSHVTDWNRTTVLVSCQQMKESLYMKSWYIGTHTIILPEQGEWPTSINV